MSQSLRNIKLRMKSIENTQKITRAMEMVSAAKLNRVKNTLFLASPYFLKLESMFKDLISASPSYSHPLLEKRDVRNTVLCLITSDAGLCSVYNYSVIRAAEEFLKNFDKNKVRLVIIGKEGFNHFRNKGFTVIKSYLDLHGKMSEKSVRETLDELVNIFQRRDADEIYVAYTGFNSTLRYRPVIEKFLGIECAKRENTDYIIEPDAKSALERMVPKYLFEKMRLIFLNAFTSEHSSRMVAMKTATDNAKELIETLTLLRNKVRQSSITKEVLEIASSAEALKG